MLDVSLSSQKRGLCNGWSRRDFIRIGALGPIGLTLSKFLAASNTFAQPLIQPARQARSVILVFLGGGLSHHDSFDMKPDALEEIRGKYGSIPTSVPGLRIGELLPRMAKVMKKVCLVRSGSHENDHHETATNWVLSGRFGSPFGDYPAIGAVVASQTGFSSVLPPYVVIPKNPSFTWELGKSAFLGGRYESFKVGDPNQKNYQVRDLTPDKSSTPMVQNRRQSLLKAVDGLARRIEGSDQLATYDQFQRKAAEMVLSSRAQEAFAVEREPDWIRDAYGRSTFGQSCLMARRLVENGVRFCTVNYGGWDHHKDIFPSLDKKLPEFDLGFSALIDDLDARGLLEETLVVALGEFGRTPKVNKDAGRDHWGRAGSLLFAGPGIGRGKVVGATDAEGAFVTEDPVRPADVAFTIYQALGIPPRGHIRTPDGRPMEILNEGGLIEALYT